MDNKQTFESPPRKASPVEIFVRLTRAQFLPLIALPVLLGTAFAYYAYHSFNPMFFALALVGALILHLGANAIDDCYDYENRVDEVADLVFPKDFAGWKPLPRQTISLKKAKAISYLLLGGSLIFAAYLTYRVGYWAIALGLIGVLLAYFYTAPPLKLDYRGLGLGELSIFAAFGPIPVMGAFYVETGFLSFSPLLISVPVGIMTVTILIDHDLIFYDVYKRSRKLSLGTVLGRARSLKLSLALTLLGYALVFAFVAVGTLPIFCIAAPVLSAIILFRRWKVFTIPSESPPFYARFTGNALFSDWLFTAVLVISLILSSNTLI